MGLFRVETDDEIFEVEADDETEADAKVEAELERRRKPAPRDWTEGDHLSPLARFGIGAAKSAASSGLGVLQSAGKLGAEITKRNPLLSEETQSGVAGYQDEFDRYLDAAQAELQPRDTAGKVGEFAEQVGEYLVPGRQTGKAIDAVRQLPRGLNFVTRQALRGIESAGLQAVREGEVDEGAAIAGAAGTVGGGIGEGLGALSGVLVRSAKRWLGDLLQPQTPADKEKVARLAERMIAERLAPAGSTRATQIDLAKDALANATAAREAIETPNALAPFQTAPVLQRVAAAAPDKLPGGHMPSSLPERRTIMSASRGQQDLSTVVGSQPLRPGQVPGQLPLRGQMPLGAAQAERRRLDDALEPFYGSGRELSPEALANVKMRADAFRHEIAEQFPDLGLANARESELISIVRLLKDAKKEIDRAGAGTAAEGAVGRAAFGYQGLLAQIAGRVGLTSGPAASGISSTLRIASRILETGNADAVLRAAALAGIDDLDPTTVQVLSDAQSRYGVE